MALVLPLLRKRGPQIPLGRLDFLADIEGFGAGAGADITGFIQVENTNADGAGSWAAALKSAVPALVSLDGISSNISLNTPNIRLGAPKIIDGRGFTGKILYDAVGGGPNIQFYPESNGSVTAFLNADGQWAAWTSDNDEGTPGATSYDLFQLRGIVGFAFYAVDLQRSADGLIDGPTYSTDGTIQRSRLRRDFQAVNLTATRISSIDNVIGGNSDNAVFRRGIQVLNGDAHSVNCAKRGWDNKAIVTSKIDNAIDPHDHASMLDEWCIYIRDGADEDEVGDEVNGGKVDLQNTQAIGGAINDLSTGTIDPTFASAARALCTIEQPANYAAWIDLLGRLCQEAGPDPVAGEGRTFRLVAEVHGTGTTLAAPIAAQAGDFAVVLYRGQGVNGGSAPVAPKSSHWDNPTGATSVSGTGTTKPFRIATMARVLDGGADDDISLTTAAAGGGADLHMLVFRAARPVTAYAGLASNASNATGSDPAAQTILGTANDLAQIQIVHWAGTAAIAGNTLSPDYMVAVVTGVTKQVAKWIAHDGIGFWDGVDRTADVGALGGDDRVGMQTLGFTFTFG